MPAFSIGNAVQFGWKTVRNHFLYFFLLQLIVGGVAVLPKIIDLIARAFADQRLKMNEGDTVAVIALLLSMALGLVCALLSAYLDLGAKRIYLKSVSTVPNDYLDLKSPLKQFLLFLCAGFLFGVMVAIGYVFLIIPGIILTLMFQFFSYAMIERGMGPLMALQYSMDITRGAKWQLFLFGLVVFGINMLGVLALGVGLFVTVPLSALAMVHVYSQLRDRHRLQSQVVPQQQMS